MVLLLNGLPLNGFAAKWFCCQMVLLSNGFAVKWFCKGSFVV